MKGNLDIINKIHDMTEWECFPPYPFATFSFQMLFRKIKNTIKDGLVREK